MNDPCQGHLNAVRKIIYSIQDVGCHDLFILKVPISNWLALKIADLAIAFSVGSALLSWCSNRQPLFILIHEREVSTIKSRDCRMLIVGKIALRLES